ncbi:hypothetical protein RvY_05652 [Ramazzottius varieornatus]|uniref:Uncharacterized protein n=1 Tax=Ramazzottius varieornatus TaxID=947166 RepID=A0A1D1UVS3_RAMVA|nr:hypothetical protein RvY_05652 [Ramazzottius varieornatus]
MFPPESHCETSREAKAGKLDCPDVTGMFMTIPNSHRHSSRQERDNQALSWENMQKNHGELWLSLAVFGRVHDSHNMIFKIFDTENSSTGWFSWPQSKNRRDKDYWQQNQVNLQDVAVLLLDGQIEENVLWGTTLHVSNEDRHVWLKCTQLAH